MTQATPLTSFACCHTILSLPCHLIDGGISLVKALAKKVVSVVSSIFDAIRSCFCAKPTTTGNLNGSQAAMNELAQQSSGVLQVLAKNAIDDVAKMPAMELIKNAKTSDAAQAMLADLLVWRIALFPDDMKGLIPKESGAPIIDLINEYREKFLTLQKGTQESFSNGFIATRFPSLGRIPSNPFDRRDQNAFNELYIAAVCLANALKKLPWFAGCVDAIRSKNDSRVESTEASDKFLRALVKNTVESLPKVAPMIKGIKDAKDVATAKELLAHVLAWRFVIAPGDIDGFFPPVEKGFSHPSIIGQVSALREKYKTLSSSERLAFSLYFMNVHLYFKESDANPDSWDEITRSVYDETLCFAKEFQKFPWFSACVEEIRSS